MRLSVQTLFLPRESLPYMEEWLLYHTILGFDRFRLYDNTGSSGDISSPFRAKYGSSRTKYGLPMPPDDVKDEEVRDLTRIVCEKFDAEIIPWPSPNYNDRVQLAAITDHCAADSSDFTAFIDMDEYVVVGGGSGIKEFMDREVVGRGFCGVRMSQQKMPHILKEKMTTGRMVWEVTETFHMETKGWAPKNILPTKSVVVGKNIHDLGCDGAILDQPDRGLIKLNHYNTSEYQMHWLKHNHMHYDRNTPFEKLFLGESHDHSLGAFAGEMSRWDYVRWEDL